MTGMAKWNEEECGDQYDCTSIKCERPKGHSGDHEGYFHELVTWERADTEVAR